MANSNQGWAHCSVVLMMLATLLAGCSADSDDTAPGGAVQWHQTVDLAPPQTADLDGEGAARDPSLGEDITIWNQGTFSATSKAAAWTQGKTPSQQDCASLLDASGTAREIPLAVGLRFCLRTNEGREGYARVTKKDGATWEFDFSVWRLAAK